MTSSNRTTINIEPEVRRILNEFRAKNLMNQNELTIGAAINLIVKSAFIDGLLMVKTPVPESLRTHER